MHCGVRRAVIRMMTLMSGPLPWLLSGMVLCLPEQYPPAGMIIHTNLEEFLKLSIFFPAACFFFLSGHALVLNCPA